MLKWTKKPIVWIAAIYFPLLLFQGIYTHISASEFWPLKLSKELLHFNTQEIGIFFKPAFHFFLSLIYFVPLSNWQHIIAGRILFVLFALGSLCLFIQSLKNLRLISLNKQTLCLICLLFLSPLFLSQVVKIRSDMLSLFFSLALLTAATGGPLPWNDRRLIVVTVLNLLLLGCTPRAVFHELVVIGFLLPWVLSQNLNAKAIRQIFISLMMPFLAFAVFFMPLPGFPGIVLTRYLKQSYVNTGDWGHVENWIRSELFLFILTMVSAAYVVIKKEKIEKLAVLPFIISWASIAVADLKTPYLTASYFPFLILPIFLFLKNISFKQIGMLAIFLLVSHISLTNSYSWGSNDLPQKEVIQKISHLLDQNPQWKIFDGLGLFPRSNEVLSYLGPEDERALQGAWYYLKETSPEVVLYTSRLTHLGNEAVELLNSKYFQIAPNLYLRKDLRTDEKIEFKIPPVFLFELYPLQN
jgi:hypothetical protein